MSIHISLDHIQTYWNEYCIVPHWLVLSLVTYLYVVVITLYMPQLIVLSLVTFLNLAAIRDDVMSLSPEGVVEVWLTSEDLGAYGHDIGVTLPQLLWQLVRVVPEGCVVRLGMTNPPYIMDHMEVSTSLTL